jgi:UPF0716 protein FxsA
MGRFLLVLFTVVPLVELYLLLFIGDLMGFWPTVGLVLLTGVIGATLAKLEGLRVLAQWQSALAEGRVPEAGVLDGLLVLVGGVLLVTPGVLTDVFGFALLLPPTRRVVARFLRKRVEKGIENGSVHVHVGGFSAAPPFGGFGGPPPGRGGSVIDVEGRDVTEQERPRELPSDV